MLIIALINMTENELAGLIIGLCIGIHKELGPGLLESMYESALAFELEQRGVSFTRQQGIPVIYKGIRQDIGFRTDIIVEDKLVVEIKSVERVEKSHHKTVLTYLKLTGTKLGLLINFNVEVLKEGIHRKILGQVF